MLRSALIDGVFYGIYNASITIIIIIGLIILARLVLIDSNQIYALINYLYMIIYMTSLAIPYITLIMVFVLILHALSRLLARSLNLLKRGFLAAKR